MCGRQLGEESKSLTHIIIIIIIITSICRVPYLGTSPFICVFTNQNKTYMESYRSSKEKVKKMYIIEYVILYF